MRKNRMQDIRERWGLGPTAEHPSGLWALLPCRNVRPQHPLLLSSLREVGNLEFSLLKVRVADLLNPIWAT